MKRTISFISSIALLVVLLTSVAVGQERQIGVGIRGAATSKNLGTGTNFGVWADAVIPLDKRVVTIGQATYDRFTLDFLPEFPQHVIGVRGEMRLYLAGEGIKPFVSGGMNMQRLKLFGTGQTFMSPKAGGGLNIHDRVIAWYSREFPDMVSPFSQTCHCMGADAYIPLGKTWRGRLGIEYQSQKIKQSPERFSRVVGSAGVAATF